MVIALGVFALAGCLSDDDSDGDEGGDTTDSDDDNESTGSARSDAINGSESEDTNAGQYPEELSSVFREMLDAADPDSFAQSSDVIQYDAENGTVATIVTTTEEDQLPEDGVYRVGDPISTADGTVRGAWVTPARLESLAEHENVTDVSVDPVPEDD